MKVRITNRKIVVKKTKKLVMRRRKKRSYYYFGEKEKKIVKQGFLDWLYNRGSLPPLKYENLYLKGYNFFS
jgi:hypothetical protein